MFKPNFMQAVLWNAFNVFLYKIILQTHQFCLFYVISNELFGISGTLFSSVYLLIGLTNFGFDYSLFAFNQSFSSCQNNFLKMMRFFLWRSIIACLTAMFLFLFFYYFSYLPQISFITQFTSIPLIALLMIMFISENIKRSFELFGYLSFLNKTITIVEIFTLLIYTSMVWSYYFLFGYINLYVIFTAMCCMSILELLIVIQRLKTFQKSLPLHDSNQSFPTTHEIILNQAVNYINQITKALFSPNMIIVFLAYHIGIIKAGYIKLTIDSIILLYMLLNRAVGIPSGALMSRRATTKNLNLPHFTTSFLTITNAYIQFLYSLLITTCMIIVPCIIKENCLSTTLSVNILFFTFAGFLEYLIITYEKLYLTQNKACTLAIINFLGFLFMIPAFWYSGYLPKMYILLPFVVIRLVSFFTIAYVAYQIWSLAPSFRIKLTTILITLPLIIFLFIWHIKA